MDSAPVYEYESKAQVAVGGIEESVLFFYWYEGCLLRETCMKWVDNGMKG